MGFNKGENESKAKIEVDLEKYNEMRSQFSDQ